MARCLIALTTALSLFSCKSRLEQANLANVGLNDPRRDVYDVMYREGQSPGANGEIVGPKVVLRHCRAPVSQTASSTCESQLDEKFMLMTDFEPALRSRLAQFQGADPSEGSQDGQVNRILDALSQSQNIVVTDGSVNPSQLEGDHKLFAIARLVVVSPTDETLEKVSSRPNTVSAPVPPTPPTMRNPIADFGILTGTCIISWLPFYREADAYRTLISNEVSAQPDPNGPGWLVDMMPRGASGPMRFRCTATTGDPKICRRVETNFHGLYMVQAISGRDITGEPRRLTLYSTDHRMGDVAVAHCVF